MNRAVSTILLPLALVLGGCAGGESDGEAAPEARSSAPSVVGSTDPECQVLSDQEAEDYLGDPVKSRWPESGNLPACRWTTRSGLALTASTVPALTSAESIWRQLSMTSATGTRTAREHDSLDRKQRRLLEDFAPLSPATVCDFFLRMGELVGLGRDDLDVIFFPSREDPRLAIGRACQDGTYVFATYSGPTSSDTEAFEGTMREVLELLLSRRSR